MTPNRHRLMIAAALILTLGLGFGLGRLIDRPPATEAARAAEDDHDEHEEDGLLPLSVEAAATAGITVVTVERGGGSELKLPGRIAFMPGAEATVDAPLSGTVVRVHVGRGDRVAAGAPLVTLRSPQGAEARAMVDAAEAEAQAALAAERRDRQLFDQGWIAEARLEITAADARRAEARLRAARAALGGYGTPSADGLVVIRSPIAGVVTRISVAPGQYLHEEALQVAVVVDTRRTELVFDAPPSAADRLKPGDTLRSQVPDGEILTGVVTAVAPADDSGIVVVRARPTGNLPPAGTVLSARIAVGTGDGRPVVPLDAVQTVDGTSVVFVVEDGGFRARPVATGRTADGHIEILSGLEGGERIAGPGAFLLKADLAKGEADHGH